MSDKQVGFLLPIGCEIFLAMVEFHFCALFLHLSHLLVKAWPLSLLC